MLSSFEMANTNPAAVVAVVQNASYAALFQQAFGATIFTDPTTAFTDIGLALQQYQLEDPSFHPYTSKYDYASQSQLSNGQPVFLTGAEERGFQVALETGVGNCFTCHFNGTITGDTQDGKEMFTDLSFRAIGVPRNTNIPPLPRTRDCRLHTTTWAVHRPEPTAPHSLPTSEQYCGLFKVPHVA